MHVDHRVGGLRERLLQIAKTVGGQYQTNVRGQRGQFLRRLGAARLRLAAIQVDGVNQLRFFAGQCAGAEDQAQAEPGKAGEGEVTAHNVASDRNAPIMRYFRLATKALALAVSWSIWRSRFFSASIMAFLPLRLSR